MAQPTTITLHPTSLPSLPAPAPVADASNEPYVNNAAMLTRMVQAKVGPPGGHQVTKVVPETIVLSSGEFARAQTGAPFEAVLAASLARAGRDATRSAGSVVQAADGTLLVGRVVQQPIEDPIDTPTPFSLAPVPAQQGDPTYQVLNPRILAIVDPSDHTWVDLRPVPPPLP